MVQLATGLALFGWQFLPSASAQPNASLLQPHRMVDVYPAVQISGLAIAANRDSALGINDILALPADAFIQLPAGSMDVSDPSWGRSLWLRITLTAHKAVPDQSPSLVTILEIQKPYLDQLTLYRPPLSVGGAWQVQRAGDFLPKDAWSLPGQFPRFLLPSPSELLAMPGGQMAVYLHVPHRIPANFDVKVWSAVKLMENIQSDYLLLGITLGAPALCGDDLYWVTDLSP